MSSKIRLIVVVTGIALVHACGAEVADAPRVGVTEQELDTVFDPALCGDTRGMQANAAWPGFGGCPTARRSSPHVGTRSANQNWRVALGGQVRSSPAIAADGTIYVGGGDNRLYAIAPNGTQRWRTSLNGSVRGTPAIGADGTVYVGSDFGGFYAIDAVTGAVRWTFLSLYPVRSSAVIGGDGTVYVAAGGQILPGNYLYALNPADGSGRPDS